MDAYAKPEDMAGSVRLAVATLLPNGHPAIEHVARFLGMRTRTLQRRLAETGTTYSQIIGEVRVATALQLIEDDSLTLAQIATTLGYSDPSHFTRAFIRWKGLTPRDYRLRGSDETMSPSPVARDRYHDKYPGTGK